MNEFCSLLKKIHKNNDKNKIMNENVKLNCLSKLTFDSGINNNITINKLNKLKIKINKL